MQRVGVCFTYFLYECFALVEFYFSAILRWRFFLVLFSPGRKSRRTFMSTCICTWYFFYPTIQKSSCNNQKLPYVSDRSVAFRPNWSSHRTHFDHSRTFFLCKLLVRLFIAILSISNLKFYFILSNRVVLFVPYEFYFKRVLKNSVRNSWK